MAMPFDETRPPKWLKPLGIFTVIFFLAAQALAVINSPADRDMGHLQKIMYVHVPSAWLAFVGFGVVLVFSLLYIWKRDLKYDLVAASAAEVGTLFTALTIAQGSIWGRPTWGVWWTWDPRLTTTAILLLIFIGYVALRSFTDDEDRRARWSAAVGILGAINVPIVYYSVKWWRTIHQVQSSPETMSRVYVVGLLLNLAAFSVLLVWFIVYRYYGSKLERRVEQRFEAAALNNGVAAEV
ncbi:MAG TPA: cytochrome c biogenesis protein CcsA [Longimicrobiales bacterium]